MTTNKKIDTNLTLSNDTNRINRFQWLISFYQSKLTRYIFKKIFDAFITFFIATTLVFYLYHMLPGSAANIFAQDPRLSAETRAALISDWGLDQPIGTQYILFLKNLLKGDLGFSFLHRRPVSEIIGESLPWTLLLLGSSFILSYIFGILLGAFIAWRRGSKTDTTFVLTYNVYNAFPLFFVGMLFVGIFGYKAKVDNWGFSFPLNGAEDPIISATGTDWEIFVDVIRHLTLPLTVLVLSGTLGLAWFVRGNMINILSEDYIQTAHAKGLSNTKVLYRHGLRNALLPIVTSMGLDFGAIVGGSVLIETVFSYPGTGFLLFESLLRKDWPVVQGAFIIIAGLTLLGLLISEILYAILDPRIRTE
ncbi:MAG: ABC transporter permease [Candidatus Heimdallarchaeota archaeon]|nr:ABC transporter permease [Candidatus Heimdallarchaeota archaeon]